MKVIEDRNIETERLHLRIPTREEQYDLWSIQRNEKVNLYYQATPSRFKTRREYQEALQNWESQKKWYYLKIDNLDKDSDRYTWSIFLKDNKVIGQMTVQPNGDYPDNPDVRDVGWYIDPDYQGQGYAYEAARAIIDFMFKEVEIKEIRTSAITVDQASWKLMEKLGFIRTGIKKATYKVRGVI